MHVSNLDNDQQSFDKTMDEIVNYIEIVFRKYYICNAFITIKLKSL